MGATRAFGNCEHTTKHLGQGCESSLALSHTLAPGGVSRCSTRHRFLGDGGIGSWATVASVPSNEPEVDGSAPDVTDTPSERAKLVAS